MEFNSSPGDLMELSPLFSDDSRVSEAASIAQKLSKMKPFYGNLRLAVFFFKSEHRSPWYNKSSVN